LGSKTAAASLFTAGLLISFGGMKNGFFSALLLLGFLGITACEKNNPVETSDVWVPAELKSLFLFYPGSYWIMELPGTNFVDSVFVDSTRIDTIPILHPGSREVIGYKEQFTVRFVSPFYGRYTTFSTFSEDFCGTLGTIGPCHRIVKSNLKSN
jgi:hypothetical protein